MLRKNATPIDAHKSLRHSKCESFENGIQLTVFDFVVTICFYVSMDPLSEINRVDLQAVVNSVYGIEQQQLRIKILAGAATHEEIIANYKNRDPLSEVFEQGLNESEESQLVDHYEAIAFANYIGGLSLLYATSPTETALRDTNNTQRAINTIIRTFITPDSTYPQPHIDHRIIDLHNAYAGKTNFDNIHLLNLTDNATRIIGAQCLRSGISDMNTLTPWRPTSPNEKIGINLSLEAAGGIVFGSMLGLSAHKFNEDGSVNRENLSQLLDTVKLYVAPSLSQTSEEFTGAQIRDFGMACAVIERALQQCSRGDLSNALVKGGLHEVLWLLDAFALIKGNPKEYGQFGIVTADYAEDRGNIQNLTLRRGHDYRVFHRDTNTGTYVQLKSHASLRNDKPYVQKIDVHREQDFHKSIQNPNLITDKLRIYYAWSQTNFNTEMFTAYGMDRLIMPTVKEVFNNLF